MNYYEINLESIKQKRPLLHSYMKAYETSQNEPENLTIETKESRDGNLYTTVMKDDKEYRLNSNYRPLEEAKRWGKQYEFNNINIVVQMFGLGNGYFLRELRDQLKKGDHIIVVEPSYELFQHVLKNYDMTDLLLDTNISIVIPMLSSSMLGVVLSDRVHWMNLKSQMRTVHPQYDKCFHTEYGQYCIRIDENNFRTLVNRNTEAYFGINVVENTIYNYRFIPESNYAIELNGKFPKGIPAIIVAAGPSLDINIDELKRAKGKAVIFATDTALRFLHKHDIVADFVVTLDPKKPPNYFDNTGFENMPMFCGANSNYEVLKKHKGRKIWFGNSEFFNRLYGDFGSKIFDLSTGGSVATSAFAVCKSLKFETIIMIGQDLAYKGDITHADGNICRIQDEEEGICYVEGIDGQMIRSRHDWYIYLKWFESAIDETKNLGEVIDATEGGALIHGAKLMTLKDAIDQYCTNTINVEEIMEQLPVTFGKREIEVVSNFIDEAYQDSKELPTQAQQIIESCDEVLRLQDKPNYEKRISSIGQQIVNANEIVSNKPVYALIDKYVKHDTFTEIEKMCDLSSEQEESFKRIYEATKQVFLSVQSASKEVEPLLKETSEFIHNYLRRI